MYTTRGWPHDTQKCLTSILTCITPVVESKTLCVLHTTTTNLLRSACTCSPKVVRPLCLAEPGPGHARQAGLLEQLEAVEHVRGLAGGLRRVGRRAGEVDLWESVQSSLRVLAGNAVQTVGRTCVIITVKTQQNKQQHVKQQQKQEEEEKGSGVGERGRGVVESRLGGWIGNLMCARALFVCTRTKEKRYQPTWGSRRIKLRCTHALRRSISESGAVRLGVRTSCAVGVLACKAFVPSFVLGCVRECARAGG